MARPPPPQFAPANQCIYCGDDKSPLQREHIIPYGLDGNIVLKKASCAACGEITKRFEQDYLRGPIWAVRTCLQFTSRRDPPDSIPINVGKTQKLIPPEDYPAIILLPALDLPGILQKLRPDCDIKSRHWAKVLQADADKLAKHGITEAGTIPLHLPTLARVLAKIAHSFTSAVVGPNGFNPFLLNIILKGDEKPWFLVGGQLDILPAEASGELHVLELEFYSTDGLPDLLAVNIRLFAKYGAPTYKVVVGSRR